MIKKITAVYFSPAGSTKKVVTETAAKVAEAVNAVPEGCDSEAFVLGAIDFTLPAARKSQYTFGPEDLVVFGTPTYAGRIPNKILPFVQEGFKGNGARALAVVTFGNRNFDSSLTELVQTLEANGFNVIGAMAAASRHAFSDTLGAGRPDEEDRAVIEEFAEKAVNMLKEGAAAEKLSAQGPDAETTLAESSASREPAMCCSMETDAHSRLTIPGREEVQPYYTPLGMDGQPAKFLKATPKTALDKCISCGACADHCPMGSINPEDTADITGVCIKCHSCVRICPMGAKYFDDPALLSHIAMLESTYTRRAKSEYYF